jgi:hypothetical protein
MRKAVLISACLAFLAFAAPSQATILPSNSAVDQYTEGIPTAKGQKSERTPGALPPGTDGPLNALGKKGAATAAAAKASAPSPGDSGPSQTSGMGIWLWLILAACLLAALTRFYARWRTSRTAA